jgi:hypothetical protein
VDVEIVLDQGDGLGVGEVDIGQLFQDVSIIYSGVASKAARVVRFGELCM